jgi:hypothetical protein
MPANHKVSIGWQIVFTFIAVLNLWAFYSKKTSQVLFVFLPSLMFSLVLTLYIYSNPAPGFYWGFNPFEIVDITWFAIFLFIHTVGVALLGFSICLVIIWSK